MVAPLRRAKLGDTAAAAFLLVAFSLVPFVLLLTDRSRVHNESLRTAYAACLGLSWPLLLLGGIPLLYYWRKDRHVDRQFFSTATTTELGVVFVSTVAVVAGCVMLLAAEIVSLVDLLKKGLQWVIIIDVAAILLLCWIVQLVVQTAMEVWAVRRDLREAPIDHSGTVNTAKVDGRQSGV